MKLLIMFIMPRKSYDHVVRERNIDEKVSSIFSQRSFLIHINMLAINVPLI